MRSPSDTEASHAGALRRRPKYRRALAVLLVIGAFLLQVATSGPASAANGDLTLASTSDTGTKANGYSNNPTVSADGTRVAFASSATNLGEGDTDTFADVYVKDLTTGALTLASTSDTGIKGNSESTDLTLSADGTRVAFYSNATNLGEGDTDTAFDVYVKDLTTGALTMANTSDTGIKANNGSFDPTLSADGTRVAFRSSATNLGEGSNGVSAVYVKNLTTGALTLASSSDTGAIAGSFSSQPTLSADGTRVAFDSFATNLGEGDNDAVLDVYVKNLTTGALTLASTSDTGLKANDSTYRATVSADGTRVAFNSYATNLGEGDADGIRDVFVKNLATGTLTLISTSDIGTKANRDSFGEAVSADGNRVAFYSDAANLGEGDNDAVPDIYVKDLTTGALTLASTSDIGTKANGSNYSPTLTADGTRVAYLSVATNLAEGDTDTFYDIYVKELPGSTTPVAAGDSYAASAGSTLTVPAPGVLTNDGDPDAGDSLRAALVSGPSHGTLALAVNGGFTYTPATGYIGSDSFTYRASDGSNSSAPATVSISVNPVNVAPVAADDSFSTDEDSAVTVAAPGVLGNDTDVNGDPLSAVLATGPSHGTLDPSADGGFTYTPAANYNGPDSFTYQASDGAASSSPATVSLTVRSVNDAPVASTGEDQTVEHKADFTLSGSGSDVDGDGVTYTWTQVSGRVAVIRDPEDAETLVEGVQGAATLVFRLTVTDPTGASSSDEVTVTVNPK